MAGGFGAYYYTYTAWDIIRPNDTPPGYEYFKNLRDFFASTGYWKMKPVEGLTSVGYCLADAGREYIVFLNSAVPFTLTLRGLPGPLTGEWYQPFTGARLAAAKISNGRFELTPPAGWGDGPVALHLMRTKPPGESTKINR
jgi:hypothetical protein